MSNGAVYEFPFFFFMVSQWSFRIYTCELGVFSRDPDIAVNCKSSHLFEISQCVLV